MNLLFSPKLLRLNRHKCQLSGIKKKYYHCQIYHLVINSQMHIPFFESSTSTKILKASSYKLDYLPLRLIFRSRRPWRTAQKSETWHWAMLTCCGHQKNSSYFEELFQGNQFCTWFVPFHILSKFGQVIDHTLYDWEFKGWHYNIFLSFCTPT